MSGRILIAALIALVSYLLIPALAAFAARQRLKGLFAKLATLPGLDCESADLDRDSLVLVPRETEQALFRPNAVSGAIALDPRKTLFYAIGRNGEAESLNWNRVLLLQGGTAASFLKRRKRFMRDICVFHEEKSAADLAALAARLTAEGAWGADSGNGTVKSFSVAIGVFLEFLVFLESFRHPGMETASIAALIGIFGKALPYLPPGLFFTIAANLPPARANDAEDSSAPREVAIQNRAKKIRQRKTAGFLLVSAGTALNIAVLFLVILKVGFGRP